LQVDEEVQKRKLANEGVDLEELDTQEPREKLYKQKTR
jgi:hypothetical protein